MESIRKPAINSDIEDAQNSNVSLKDRKLASYLDINYVVVTYDQSITMKFLKIFRKNDQISFLI